MNRSLWVDPAESAYPRLEGIVTADVAIVGGGLTGIGAAVALREAGLRVVLVEERALSSGASGRNAGFMLAGPAMPFGEACEALGPEEAQAVWRLTLENNRIMAQLIERHAIDCGYLRRGSMSLAASPDEMALLVTTAKCLSGAGVDVCVVSSEDLPRPFDRWYAGGVYYPGNAELNPAAFVRAMAGVISDRVVVFERTRVDELRAGKPHMLMTEHGALEAEIVILATNAYTARLWPEAPIVPTRGQVLSTRPVSDVVVPFPMYADRGYQYWRQTPQGHLVVGGWRDTDIAGEVGTDETLHAVIQDRLQQFARAIGVDGVEIEYRWAGIMGFTPDALPTVGPMPGLQGIYVSAGYSGHGVSMAFRCGGLVAQAATGGNPSIPRAFDPARFSAATASTGEAVSSV